MHARERLTPRMAETLWEPMLDFSATGKEFVVRLEVPGVTRDDLDVKLDGNLLTLSGKRELQRQEKGEDFLWEEREEGKFMRTLRVPSAVQEGKIVRSIPMGSSRFGCRKPSPR